MCGFIISNLNFNKKNLSNSIQHRGPDSSGYYKDDFVNIVFNRLSIIDLNKRSDQPFRYKNFILAFNGEIYNYLEIKKELINFGYKFKTTSDTEVLLYSYIKWGKECLKKFEGI